ncbi:hypothetical protein Hanom_Chr14g01261251 [Helianthus anomalus]
MEYFGGSVSQQQSPNHCKDYPSNNRSNHREHTCYFENVGTKGETMTNHMDYQGN